MKQSALTIAAISLAALCASCGDDEPDREGAGGGSAWPAPQGGSPAFAPVPECGNGRTEAGEACDGADRNGFTCATVATELTGGTLGCLSDCSGYDVTGCEAGGQTIGAASCEQQDVQAAIDSAADGDVVEVPAGACTWASADECDGPNVCPPVVIVNKSIVLRGAGPSATIITSMVPESWQHATIRADNDSDHPFRITGFRIDNVVGTAISVGGSNQAFRIDNCMVNPQPGSAVNAVEVTGPSYGVVDHCVFDTAEIIVLPDEDDAWDRPLTLGTASAVYVEDSTFTNPGAIDDLVDGRSGARFVVRNNTWTNMELHCHGIEGGGSRGTHSYELYGNTGICDGSTNCYRSGYLRGGTGVVFDNSWSGESPSGGALQVVHQCAYREECTDFKACDRYPCHDQIGRTTDHNQDGWQDLVPLFEWNNTSNGDDVDLAVQDDTYPVVGVYVQEGRDFFNDAVTLNPETGCYEATYTGDDGLEKRWRYRPFVEPHPLVQIELDRQGG